MPSTVSFSKEGAPGLLPHLSHEAGLEILKDPKLTVLL